MTSSYGHKVIKFIGKNVWQSFKFEGGQHCVQRYPKNDRGGRRHTSIVSVAVLPLPPTKEYKPLPDSELNIIAQIGKQTAGGQNANKVASAIRMTHKPTGLQVFIQNERDQHQNKKVALQILTAKVNELINSKKQNDYNIVRKIQLGDGGRGVKTRTYNFIESRVTDHKLNKKSSQIDKIMNGRFDLLIT